MNEKASRTELAQQLVVTPVGRLRLVAGPAALLAVWFPEHRGAGPEAPAAGRHPILELAAEELAAYFAGELRRFTTPLRAEGSAFQLAVWAELAAIPFGERRSYGELAARLGRVGAQRAVGAANGKNPLSIFVPCHRVVAGSGALSGYAGGVEAKRWLLAHEARVAAAARGAAQR